jgi:hypothetical protein
MIVNIIFACFLLFLLITDIYNTCFIRKYAKYNNHARNSNYHFLSAEIQRVEKRYQLRLKALEDLYVDSKNDIYKLNSKFQNHKHDIT